MDGPLLYFQIDIKDHQGTNMTKLKFIRYEAKNMRKYSVKCLIYENTVIRIHTNLEPSVYGYAILQFSSSFCLLFS